MSWKKIQQKVNNEHYIELNRKEKQSKVFTSTCAWCGETFVKKANKQKYCSEYCRYSARLHQSRMKSHRWYHRHKHELSEKQRWGLGSGVIGQHRNEDFNREHEVITKELRRLGIKKKRL